MRFNAETQRPQRKRREDILMRRSGGSGEERRESYCYRGAMVSAPGRVNLIGEHIDYHGLPVLPMALRRSIRVHFQARADCQIRVTSGAYGHREFAWKRGLTPVARGDWENYLRAAAQAIAGKWGVMNGIDATIDSDLPPAAGLSSSSALIVAITLALLRANQREATFEELMEILPDGEQFVGTRGGGMDHAASLASREGCASLIEFAPLAVHHIPIPAGWAFLVSNSLHPAEKSGAVCRLLATRKAQPAGIGMWCTASGANSISEAQPSREPSDAAWSMPPPRVPTNCSPSGRISISSSNVASRWLARSSARVMATISADDEESPAAAGRSLSMVASMPFMTPHLPAMA